MTRIFARWNFIPSNPRGSKREIRERAGLKWWAQKYVDNGAYCLKHKINVGDTAAKFDFFVMRNTFSFLR